jgi:uncharacterized cupredoxin-like copper-binding protein
VTFTELRARRPVVALVTLAAVAGLAFAGCGDDDDDGDTTTGVTGVTGTSGPAGAAKQSEINVSETEFELTPANPTIQAGQATIEVSNDGETVHNLEVEGPNGEEELEDDLQPGETGTLEVDLSEPGTYEWYCPVGNHRDQGMEGEITVE